MGLVVITGAGSGIGAALSETLAARRCSLVLIGRSASVEATARRIRATGASAALWCLRGDIGDTEARRELLERINSIAVEAAMGIDALVHAAAVGAPSAGLDDVAATDLERALAVNTVAPLALSQGLLPLLEQGHRGGRILLITSGVAPRAQPGTGAYGISKAALERLWRQLQTDLDYEQRSERVAVGLFQPGIVDTAGLRDHIARAAACGLPHADYLQQAIDAGAARPPEAVASAIARLLLETPAPAFAHEPWHSRDLLGD